MYEWKRRRLSCLYASNQLHRNTKCFFYPLIIQYNYNNLGILEFIIKKILLSDKSDLILLPLSFVFQWKIYQHIYWNQKWTFSKFCSIKVAQNFLCENNFDEKWSASFIQDSPRLLSCKTDEKWCQDLILPSTFQLLHFLQGTSPNHLSTFCSVTWINVDFILKDALLTCWLKRTKNQYRIHLHLESFINKLNF